MERYIKRINDKLIAEEGIERARKVKKIYQTTGGILLAIGLAGFVGLFVAFMILFFKFNTDDAFTCWLIAVPFLVLLVPGSVLARIGDALLPEEKKPKTKKKKEEELDKKEIEKEEKAQNSEGQQKKERKKKKTQNK